MKQQPIRNRSKWISFPFWDKNTNHIVTRYLGLLYFGRATAADLTSMLTDVMNSDEYEIPWERLFYISSDGQTLIRLYREIWTKNWKIKDTKGCKLRWNHFIWTRSLFCFRFYLVNLKTSLGCLRLAKNNETLFLHHVRSRWLTLSSSFEVVLKTKENWCKYFLAYLLLQNIIFQRISSIIELRNVWEKMQKCVFMC